MKIYLRILCFVGLLSGSWVTMAQDANYPLEHIWNNRLGEHFTTSMPLKGQTTIYVVHYFAPITKNGISDVFGIYGTANLQMGAEYGIGKNFSTYFFTEKINKTQELGVRYRLVEQDVMNENPVGVALSFSVSADARDEEYFGKNYFFVDRFFYTGQLAVSKVLNEKWELLLNGTFAHLNIVPEGAFSTYFSLNPGLTYKLSDNSALFATGDFPLGIASASENEPESARPLTTLGAVLKTYTHNFQIFVSNGNQIALAKEYLNNRGGFDLDSFCFGFNIQIKIGAGK